MSAGWSSIHFYSHVYVRLSNIPLLMQLSELDLDKSNLEGTLPESWSNLINVSLCHNSLYLLIGVVAAAVLSCKALAN